MPMCEITIESRTCVEEHGHTVLYEKQYCGIQKEDGRFRLLAYSSKRTPLTKAMRMHLTGQEDTWKESA